MRQAETVTFGGAGSDRHSGLRADPARVAALLADPAARVLPLWRGKPLVAGPARDHLGWLQPGCEALDLADPPVLLGLSPEGPRFAADLSRWQPAETDAAALAAFFDPSEQYHPALPTDHLFAELRGVMTRLSPAEAEYAATARAILGWHRTHGFCAACGAPTELTMAGWQRRCPSCGAHHFPRTDPVVIMLVTRGNSVLLGRSPGWPERMYSLLAGFMEPGETIEAAVRREVREETGVQVGAVSYLASQPWPFPASLMIGCRGIALSEALALDPVEIEDALWLPREELATVFADAHPAIAAPRRGAIAHFLLRNWLADRLD
ncbi:NAD(+) diphosphatase [Plastorhodobacter daqingensis]|uniref:NAD(+) diphosphatase n=1 Tax=Plastorhodobacter daqingensis TaxID=1387281 RepID=A0ABW2UNF8_9RHOB